MVKRRWKMGRRLTTLATSGLLIMTIAGCGQGNAASTVANKTAVNGAGGGGSAGGNAAGNTGGSVSGSVSGNTTGSASRNTTGNASGTSTNAPTPTSTSSPASGALVALSENPGKITYGSYQYTIPVPKADDGGNSTHVTAIDIPGGILWMTPSSFPDEAGTPLSSAALWFTSAQTKGGSIWTGCILLHQFRGGEQPRIVGVTNGYAIVKMEDGAGGTRVSAYSVKDGHAVSIGAYTAGTSTTWGHGVFVWADSHDQIHVVQVATGAEQSLPWSGKPPAMSVVGGGIQVGKQVVPVKLVTTPVYGPVPASFHWIYLGQEKYPVVRVPYNWTSTEWLPGGSSQEVTAKNPQDANEKVSVSLNACEGCYDPTVTSPQDIGSVDSPLLLVQPGETYVWLTDHVVAYTLPASKTDPYKTYGLTMTYPVQSGNEEISVTVPSDQKQLATEILDGVLSQAGF